MIRWPWTSLQALNLDWILAKMKELEQKVISYGKKLVGVTTNTGAEGSDADVSISGDLDTGLSFEFTIPRGNTGATGATGATGPQGPEGPEGPQGPTGPAGADGIGSVTFVTLNLAETGSITMNAHGSQTLHFIMSGGLTTSNFIGIRAYVYRVSASIIADSIVMTEVIPDSDNSLLEVIVFNAGSSAVTLAADLCHVTVAKFNI